MVAGFYHVGYEDPLLMVMRRKTVHGQSLLILLRNSLFLAPVLQAGLYERIYRDEKIVHSLISSTERSINGFSMCFPLHGHLVRGLFDVILSNKL